MHYYRWPGIRAEDDLYFSKNYLPASHGYRIIIKAAGDWLPLRGVGQAVYFYIGQHEGLTRTRPLRGLVLVCIN